MPLSIFHACVVFCLSVVLATGTASADTQGKPEPPGQPASGPGSNDYPFEHTRITAYGEGAGGYYIIEPREAPKQALPVVLFVHGMGATSYGGYHAWVTHLVRKGNVVLFPLYHDKGIVDPATFTNTAAAAAAEAIKRCDGDTHALIDTDRLTMVGHSLGGTIIANLAARPRHFKLPAPKAIMPLQSGDTRADSGLGALLSSITEDHSTIAKGTLMLIVDVEKDRIVSPKVGQRIHDNADRVAVRNKRRLVLRNDDHGEPTIIADHMLPNGWFDRQKRHVSVNTYDFALWRWFDSLQALAHGDEEHRDHVFGEVALNLGHWSDGTPVRRPIDASAGKLEP